MARILLVLALLPALAACGVRGGLQTPAPLWGDPDQEVRPLPQPYERDDFNDEALQGADEPGEPDAEPEPEPEPGG